MIFVDIRKRTANPPAIDIGNRSMQGMTVSKTIQFSMFTTNRNAVWAAKQQLQKESYPFAYVSFTVNRDAFRYQVGDVFKWSWSKYGISNMICRVLQIEEESLESENITIYAMQDIFSATNAITVYTEPEDDDDTEEQLDYLVTPLVYQDVIEAPYLVSNDSIGIIPLAVRTSDILTGYVLYMSSDGGSSYSSIGTYSSFAAYGTLVAAYTTDRHQIDDIGMTVDFVNEDIDQFSNLTRQDLLGLKNIAIINNEIMTIQNIIPISGTQYQLTGIYGGRFDTEIASHSIGDGVFIANGNYLDLNLNVNLLPETSRKFKFVPFNSKVNGVVTDSLVTDLTIESRSRKPYRPINLKVNGDSVVPTYSSDNVLTWSPRVRGAGAGIFAPSVTDKAISWEGYFEVEVYVSSILVRTATTIDDDTWTYTSSMNTTDNGTLATEIVFKLKNYIEYSAWVDGESAQTEITVEKE